LHSNKNKTFDLKTDFYDRPYAITIAIIKGNNNKKSMPIIC